MASGLAYEGFYRFQRDPDDVYQCSAKLTFNGHTVWDERISIGDFTQTQEGAGKDFKLTLPKTSLDAVEVLTGGKLATLTHYITAGT